MIRAFILRWKAETPKRWKFVRDTALLVSGSIAAGALIISLDEMPEWLRYVAFGCGAIAFFAQQKEVTSSEVKTAIKKEVKKEVKEKIKEEVKK